MLAASLWQALDGPPALAENISFAGESEGLPSRFDVGGLASASIGVASLAVAELWGARTGERPRKVRIDRRLAGAAFRCERLVKPLGWSLPEAWDPIAGDYRARDGWIRLHTNYAHHRAAATGVLGVEADRKAVEAAVSGWSADELESAVVEAGGAAAALRTPEAWAAHPQGRALAAEPLVHWDEGGKGRERKAGNHAAPLAGIRVLDLTRVFAGPVGSRFLAAYGADVLRIDPPGFEEVGALQPEMTLGKRCAALDLRTPAGRAGFDALVRGADLLLHGYRPGAMEALGYPEAALRSLNPALGIVRHDAYGWSGPWAQRRGFDSLVQMSTGIAHPGNDGQPTPLPAQALDHATGYLIAAAACRLLTEGRAGARLSLARTAHLLLELGEGSADSQAASADAANLLEKRETAWGPVLGVPAAGLIEGHQPRWTVPAGPLGRDPARWL